MTATRRFLIPEVVQVSDMDCGPATLKCLLEGFGIDTSYARLREACQTDVDGTSIDTLEAVAKQLGLDAEQIVVPVDHVLREPAHALPCIAVVRLGNGVTHFLVVWSVHGPLVQVMDPASGRRWMPKKRLLDELYVHTLPVGPEAWREWAGSDEFVDTLRARCFELGGEGANAGAIETALADPSWKPIAALDAAVRISRSIVDSGGIDRGPEAAAAVESFWKRALEEGEGECRAIPRWFWSVRPSGEAPGDDEDEAPADDETLDFKGAVLVRVRGRAERAAASATQATDNATLSPDLVAALEEPPPQPGRELLRLLKADKLFTPAAIAAALALASFAVVIEALLFRGLIDIGRDLGLGGQRLGALIALLVFGVAMLALELPVATGLLRLGRRLEARLRIAFLRKLPRIGDRYIHSRLTSDMAERSHSIHRVRELPEMGGMLLRATFELALTVAGIAWLSPASTPFAIIAALVAIGLPLAMQPVLAERDLRVRNHAGALSRFYLDALLGLVAVRSHAAERSVRREHERLLIEWGRANIVQQRAVVLAEAVQLLSGFGLVWVLVSQLAARGEPGSFLLAAFWALSLPALGEQIAMLARQYPDHRNVTLRLLEPLGAPDEVDADASDAPDAPPAPGGAAIAFDGVAVSVAGHSILEGVTLSIGAGQHVAVVGASGAGKSTLVGLLLGWHQPADGRITVDGEPLAGQALGRLRRATAWVDPGVHIWNRSVIENLRYGSDLDGAAPVGHAIDAAELRELLMALPDGLQTSLGESGALVSGGEGQRVRLARAMLRGDVRLAVLDEPFRGLGRDRRTTLLERARRQWRSATMICVTHDVAETKTFDRVVVVEDGAIVEQGAPAELATSGSRYQAMLDAEREARETLWSGDHWRRIAIERGQVASDRGAR